MAYSIELRERAIARMLTPVNASISAVSRELIIPDPNLYAWRGLPPGVVYQWVH
jgi:hypothetical protein